MKELVKEKYNGYINDMRKAVGNREERWNILQQCIGMLQFAYDLELLHIFDASDMYDNLFKEKACDTVEAIKKFEQEEANMLPFEEVSEEEQETFEIEDLPFPEVMEKSPEKPDAEKMKELFKKLYEECIKCIQEDQDKDLRTHFHSKGCGILHFASALGIIDYIEYFDMLNELSKERNKDTLQVLEASEKEEGKLPFEEVPEEEQEIFEIDDLPFPEVMNKSPEEFIEIPEENVLPFPPEEAESEAEKMQKLLKKRYDIYVDAIREVRDKDWCRTYHGKVTGMLDFAMDLGIIDFAENSCMYCNMNKIAGESFSRCEDPLETLRNAIKSGEYIDADIARIKVDEQCNLMKFKFSLPGVCDETDLHFMHGYMRCVADIGVMSEDSAEDVIKEFTKLYEESENQYFEIGYDRPELEVFFKNAFGFVPRGDITCHHISNEGLFKCKENSLVYRIKINQDGKVEAVIAREIKRLNVNERIYTRSYASIEELAKYGFDNGNAPALSQELHK